MTGRFGLRTAAAFEALKGAAVLVAGSGLLLLVHRDAQAVAERIVMHLHLNPAARYPRIFIELATRSTGPHLRLLAAGALAYSLVRFIEAFGLWREQRWAEWLGVLSGAVYIPFEARALVHRPGAEPALALGLNLVVVLFLLRQLQLSGPAAS